jgi:putative ABC transport system permease protein
MALGAESWQVAGRVLRDGLRLVFLGVTMGAAISWFAMRGLQSMLYGVTTTDPGVWIASTFVLLAVGFLASYVRAYRAASVDPMTALRHE